MLSVTEAQSQILSHCHPLPAQASPLGPTALGRVLAESIHSDLDMPPFDKSTMDGYAVRSADFPGGKATLTVVGEVMAGQTPSAAVGPGQAVRIMTGAPVPSGADAVVMVERTRPLDGARVEFTDTPRPRQNILTRAKEMRAGDEILSPGTVLRPQHFGILATVGRTSALLVPSPTVAVLATGNELLDPARTPGPGQIRNSNAPMLLAQVARAGAVPHDLGIARDDPANLREHIRAGLSKADVLILSGGVSAGDLDLVPGVLAEEGVVISFHKIRMKPGKPLLFGTWRQADGRMRLVFGLPGNPVSSFVCFELFVRPALRSLAGHRSLSRPVVTATLKGDFSYSTDRPTYYPARLEWDELKWRVEMLPWLGSADLRALLPADGLAELPAGDLDYESGTFLEVLRLDG
jgi:molybdopterin molybdotransferase